MKIRFWPSCLILALATAAGAQDMQARMPGGLPAAGGFPENDEIRLQLRELIFAPIGREGQALPGVDGGRIFSQRIAAHKVKVRIERQQGHVYTLFLNERPARERDAGQASGQFPIAGAGAYIIKRDLRDGSFVQVKIYLRDDPECFVRLFPYGDRSSLDAYLFGVPVARRVVIPLEFESALVEPFARLMRASGSTVPWERFFTRGEPELDRRARGLAQAIRDRLGDLGDREDGALDANGRFVFIESGLPQEGAPGLNCSGFAKWVTDGFVHPLTGRYLGIEELKAKHLESRGNRWSRRFEDERDPYFGLDWSRNLALSLLGAAGFPIAGPEASDVRLNEYVRYTEDVGYPVEELQLVLYLETARSPGMFYLGSVNREYGNDPVLRQHFHLLVLLPYFTESGAFRVAVFDRGRESSLAEVQRGFAGNFVHLVRLPMGDSFQPPLPAR